MNFSNKNQELPKTSKKMVSKTLKPISLEEANENSKEIFNNVKGKIGMLPNLYATMGVSGQIIRRVLSFYRNFEKRSVFGKGI